MKVNNDVGEDNTIEEKEGKKIDDGNKNTKDEETLEDTSDKNTSKKQKQRKIHRE